MRKLRWSMAVLLVSVLVTGLNGAPAGAAKVSAKTVKLAPGLTWTSIVDPMGPFRINVLTVKPSRFVRLDVTQAGTVLPAIATTSRMAKRAHALAAVNGDFGAWDGAATHPYMQDGDLVQTGVQVGSLLAFATNLKLAYVGRPDLSLTVDDGGSHKPRKIAAWNGGPPLLDQMVGFTDAGGTLQVPPAGACSVRLLPSGPSTWAPGKLEMQGTYTVDTVECGGSSMPTKGGVVLSTLPTSIRAGWVQSLVPGQALTVARSVGWAKVAEAIGGMPVLVQAGLSVAPTLCSPVEFCYRDPRTGVGINDACMAGSAECRVFLMTVDGRAAGSVGMTLTEEAERLLQLGATWAMNLDGGGSTVMWIRGYGVVNRPSDGRERRVPNALVIVPKK